MTQTNKACPACKSAALQQDQSGKITVCADCGARFEHDAAQSRTELKASKGGGLSRVRRLLERKAYGKAERVCNAMLELNPADWKALWLRLRARTRNLEPTELKEPEDFNMSQALELFEQAPPELSLKWKNIYFNAYARSCAYTIRSYSLSFFAEEYLLKPNDLEDGLEKTLDADYPIKELAAGEIGRRMDSIAAGLPRVFIDRLERIAEETANSIAQRYKAGFQAIPPLCAGNFSGLLGIWAAIASPREPDAEFIRFTSNPAGVAVCEYISPVSGALEHYRYIKAYESGALSCREMRRFPSRKGSGGDFFELEPPKAFVKILVAFDDLLVLSGGVFRKISPESPEALLAAEFAAERYGMPCYMSDEYASVQMHPIAKTQDTARPAGRVGECFVATAVYEDADAPNVLALRRFRDEALNTCRLGRALSSAYYRRGPWLARRIGGTWLSKRLIRGILDAFVRIWDRKR